MKSTPNVQFCISLGMLAVVKLFMLHYYVQKMRIYLQQYIIITPSSTQNGLSKTKIYGHVFKLASRLLQYYQ